MRALIVDDERLARAEVRRLLREFADVEVVGEAAGIDDAHRLVQELRPEVLFLDIEMPGGSGFELLERLEDMPVVVFTTAYDVHAVRAFEVNALDYLLKPIEQSRLASALERVRSKLAGSSRGSRRHLERLFVKDGDYCRLVELAEVPLFESEGNYSRLMIRGRQPLLLRSLNYLEEHLDPNRFFRANRRQLVNLSWVDRIEPGPSAQLVFAMREGGEVLVSRRQSARFRRTMEP